jgi:hypothetical protein
LLAAPLSEWRKLDVVSKTEVRFEGVHCSVVVDRPAPDVLVIRVEGADVGELGERPFRELSRDLEGATPIHLFIDARAATGASIEVSAHWGTWLRANQLRFGNVTMLPGSRFVEITASFVREFSGLRDRMRIETDPAAFDAALRAACTAARPTPR